MTVVTPGLARERLLVGVEDEGDRRVADRVRRDLPAGEVRLDDLAPQLAGALG